MATTNCPDRCRRSSDRGAAIIEYVMVLTLFALSVMVGFESINDSAADEAEATAGQIGGDPATSSTTSTLPGPTTTGAPTSTGAPTFPVNAPPDVSMPDLVMRPGETRNVVGLIVDDFSLLSSLIVDWELDVDGLRLNGEPIMNDATGEITFNVTALQPGEYDIDVCANDGLAEEDCSDSDIKVTNGEITISIAEVWSGWWWNGSVYMAESYLLLEVSDDWGNLVEDVTITATMRFASGAVRALSCTTDDDGRCWMGETYHQPAQATTITITGATGECIDGYVIPDDTVEIPSPGAPPPPPLPTTTSSTTTTVRPSTTTTVRPSTTTTVRPSTTTSTTTTSTTPNTST